MIRSWLRSVSLALALCVVAFGCSGSDGDDQADAGATLRGAGDISVDSADIATPGQTNDEGGSAGASENEEGTEDDQGDADESEPDDSSSTSTLPQNEEEGGEINDMMTALSVFNECLADRGTEFLGLPDGTDTDSPLNDPGYIENLQDCAAVSQIQQAFQDVQAARNEITDPEEIEEANRGLVIWAECMEGRGWTVELTANEVGLLAPNPTPPDGESILDSNDMQACADLAQEETDS